MVTAAPVDVTLTVSFAGSVRCLALFKAVGYILAFTTNHANLLHLL